MNSKTQPLENTHQLLKERIELIEEKYKQLFEESPFSIVMLSEEGEIIEINPLTERLFGYSREDLLGKNYLKISAYPSESAPILREHFTNLIEGKHLKPIEFQIYKKDRSPISIVAFLSLIKLKRQKMVQAILLDTTERKEQEYVLERKLEIESMISTISSLFIGDIEFDKAFYFSLKKIGNLYEATRAFILLYNDEDNLEFFIQVPCLESNKVELIQFNTLSTDIFPWCKEEYASRGYVFIPDVSKLPPHANQTRLTLSYLKINSLLIYPLIIKDNLKGFLGFDSLDKKLNWNKTDLPMIQTCSEIISNALDRKWSQETLRGSNQLLVGILSSLTEIIALIDKNLSIIWTNNVAQAKFGRNMADNTCFQVFVKRDSPCKNCIAFKTFEDGLIHETELNLIDEEAKDLICWATSSPAAIDYEGDTELALLILRDITKKKEIEIKLKEMNENLMQKVEERTLELTISEENYKRMLNELDVGFYQGEYKGKLLKHNVAFNKIFGIDPEISLVGANASQFFVDEKIQDDYYETLTKLGYIQNFIAELNSPVGERIRVQLNSHLIRDEKGKPSIIEGTVIKY
jgi:PAS domain S-box-containing protein